MDLGLVVVLVYIDFNFVVKARNFVMARNRNFNPIAYFIEARNFIVTMDWNFVVNFNMIITYFVEVKSFIMDWNFVSFDFPLIVAYSKDFVVIAYFMEVESLIVVRNFVIDLDIIDWSFVIDFDMIIAYKFH